MNANWFRNGEISREVVDKSFPMPILKPSTPPKKNTKPNEKTLQPKKGTSARGRPFTKGKEQAAYAPPPPRAPSWWEKLSPERKLDVVGFGLAFSGVIILLGLLSSNRSLPVEKVIIFFARLFGWGVYVLPIGLLFFGLWLVFRKIERIPPLSLERAIGSIILFLWLLTLLHVFVATAETAEAIALTGVGGGYIGSIFLRLLSLGLGDVGTAIALFAWLLIGITVTLDRSEEHTSELQSQSNLVCRLLLEKKKNTKKLILMASRVSSKPLFFPPLPYVYDQSILMN